MAVREERLPTYAQVQPEAAAHRDRVVGEKVEDNEPGLLELADGLQHARDLADKEVGRSIAGKPRGSGEAEDPFGLIIIEDASEAADCDLLGIADVPARYKSTRFEGKPPADILGKPMRAVCRRRRLSRSR